jgi:hypothetical protein
MADFCNVCSDQLFGDNAQPEIDVKSIVKDLKNNHYYTVLCEGCGMIAIEKDEKGEISLITQDSQTNEYCFHTYEEWEEGKLSEKYI